MHSGPGYVELHLHTCYSLLDGASQPAELAARAAELGYRALAVTDHDGLYGAMAFAQACAAVGIRPIVGVELTLRHGLLDVASGPVHLTLLAESGRGYANLCRLVTAAHRAGPRDAPALDPADLEAHADGVIALSGCRSGEVACLVDAGRFADAVEAARRLARLFGPRGTFVELQHNLVRGDTRRVARLVELAGHLGLGVVATGNVHYHVRERHRLQDALVAIRHRTTLEASHRLRRANSEFFLRAPEEAAAVFASYPEAVVNAAVIGARCAEGFNLADRRDLGYTFPDFTRRAAEQQAPAEDVLAAHCRERFIARYPAEGTDQELRERAWRQLKAELALIARHHLAGFFLVYRDLQDMATEVAREVRGVGTIRGGSGLPPGRGRGSSVSSIVCYLIGLSHVDPVRHRLFFRRFLNEDLETVPDIDLDFARDIRAALILRVYERYGPDHAALVCSFATYRLRSAVRDLGKVLGLPPTALDALARLSDGGGADTVRRELERLPDFRGQADGPLWGHLIELAEQVDGFPRHIGQHVGGMVISSRPLVEMVPVQPAAMEGRFICQWDKDACDDAGFLKIDFLALGMLSLVESCLELIWQQREERVDLAAIAYDDPAVYDAICQGDTVGLFQIESRAQIQMLTRARPRNLDDLAVQVAIVRPGPIVGGAVNPYIRRRELQRRYPRYVPRADHPLLEDVLRDTLGVVLYQDQVLEAAAKLGGFSPGQADRFRRALSRRRSPVAVEGFRETFMRGTRAQGVAEPLARRIFDKLAGFSGFGFPKSHAYAFAVLAYQSAWLRHYYPEEFLCALLDNQPMGFYAPHVLVGDARRRGIAVLRPTINSGGVRCTPGRRQVRLGLTTVRGIGEELAEAIVAQRAANGPYRSLGDLLRRTGLPRLAAEHLIAVGAMSELGLGRRELLWQLGLLLPRQSSPTRARRGAGGRQLALELPTEQDVPCLPDMGTWERMVADYGLLSLSPSYHPLGLMRPHLPAELLTAAGLRAARDGTRARIAGLVVCRQRPETARGFLFLLLEDETGLTNVVVRPDLYEAERSVLRGEPYLTVEGIVQRRSDSLNLLAARITCLPSVPDALLQTPTVRRPDPAYPDDARAGPTPATSASRGIVGTLRSVTPTSHDFR